MKKSLKKIVWGIVIIFILAVIVLNQNYGNVLFNLQGLQNFVDSLGIWGPIILIAVIAVQGVVSIFPVAIFFVLAGSSFGFVLGSVYCLVGTLLGATISFKIARKYGKKVEYYLLSKKNAEEFIKFTKNKGGYLTSFGRMVPLFPVDVISFSAGIENMKYGKFLWTSAIGFIVPIILFIFVGDIILQSSTLIIIGAIILILGMFFIQQNHHKIIKYLSKIRKK